jgi:hypothetical protein
MKDRTAHRAAPLWIDAVKVTHSLSWPLTHTSGLSEVSSLVLPIIGTFGLLLVTAITLLLHRQLNSVPRARLAPQLCWQAWDFEIVKLIHCFD